MKYRLKNKDRTVCLDWKVEIQVDNKDRIVCLDWKDEIQVEE